MYTDLAFLPTYYGDGTLVDTPTTEDMYEFAYEHGRRSVEEQPYHAEELAITWGVYDFVFWCGYYGDPMPPVPVEEAEVRGAA